MIVEFTHVMDLCMAVVTGRNAVVRLCCQNLVRFELAVSPAFLSISCLEKPATAAAAIIVRPVWMHLNKIFFTHHRFHRVPQIFGHRISKGLAYQLAGVLNRKLDFQVLVPIGINLQLSFPDPLGIILNDTLYFKVVLNFEFFQSEPDCEKLVPSLGIEPDLGL
jgi:hypothetical protein